MFANVCKCGGSAWSHQAWASHFLAMVGWLVLQSVSASRKIMVCVRRDISCAGLGANNPPPQTCAGRRILEPWESRPSLFGFVGREPGREVDRKGMFHACLCCLGPMRSGQNTSDSLVTSCGPSLGWLPGQLQGKLDSSGDCRAVHGSRCWSFSNHSGVGIRCARVAFPGETGAARRLSRCEQRGIETCTILEGSGMDPIATSSIATTTAAAGTPQRHANLWHGWSVFLGSKRSEILIDMNRY